MTAPVRLQLSRRAGFNLQAFSKATNGLPAINVARPGQWGNPFVIGDPCHADFLLRFANVGSVASPPLAGVGR